MGQKKNQDHEVTENTIYCDKKYGNRKIIVRNSIKSMIIEFKPLSTNYVHIKVARFFNLSIINAHTFMEEKKEEYCLVC